MSEAIIVALITGVLGLLGTIYANNRAAKDMDGQAGQAAGDHGHKAGRADPGGANAQHFAQRIPVMEEQIKMANHRISNLEKERGE